jgi:hypothetical protein
MKLRKTSAKSYKNALRCLMAFCGTSITLCATPAMTQIEFRDVTQEQGIFHPGHTEHTFFDFNNDGFLDLITDT